MASYYGWKKVDISSYDAFRREVLGNDAVLTVDLGVSSITGAVTVVLKDKDGNVVKSLTNASYVDGKPVFIFTGLGAGEYGVFVAYAGSTNYNVFAQQKVGNNLTVAKADIVLIVSAEGIVYGNPAEIIIEVPADADGTVTVTVGGKSNSTSTKGTDGKYHVFINGLDADANAYTVTVNYSDDVNYNDNTTTVSLKVNKSDISRVVVLPFGVVYGNDDF